MATSPAMNPAFWAGMDPSNSGDLIDLQKKQMIAQMLLQQGMQQPSGTESVGGVAIRRSPLEGLSKILQAYTGSKMMGDYADKLGYLNRQGYANLTGQPTMASPNQGPQPEQSQPSPEQQALALGPAQGSAGPTLQNAALANALRSQPQQQPQAPPQVPQPVAPMAPGGALNPGNLPLPLASLGLQNDPGAYFTAQAGAVAPTPEMKMAAAVYGQNSPQYQDALKAQVTKAGYIAPVSGRPGGWMVYPDGHREWNPHVPDNSMPIAGPNGEFQGVQPIPGAMNVAQQTAQAAGLGKAGAVPSIAYDESGKPVFSTQLQDVMRAQGWTPPSGAVPPGRPGSPEAAASAPTVANLQEQRRQVASNGGQPITPDIKPGIDRELARIDAQISQAQGGMSPQLPAGLQAYRENQANAAGVRATETRKAAADSPTRVNVLDNIIALADNSGPGAETMNKFLGYAANLPGASKIMSGTQDKVAQFQEMKKFMTQNAMRSWQAAGGTGTDSQLDIAMQAQPGDKLFPQAVRKISAWAKAGELAVQGKANAQDAWIQTHGDNPQSQTQFESAWRNTWDPMLFNLKTMPPAEAAAYTANLQQKQPNKYAELLQRAARLKELGGL